MTDLGDRILEEIRGLPSPEDGWEVPPPVFREMEGSFVSYEEGRSLEIEFPLFHRYAGPTGMTQGGVLATAFDNAYGPLAFLAAREFAVTLSLDVSFVRPLPVSAGSFTVEASVVEVTRKLVFLEGRARDPAGKLAATSDTEMIIVGAERG